MKRKESINTRFLELDALRDIAAIAVVFFHFTFGYDNGQHLLSDNRFYFKYGYLGVQLFFLISGFVILMTLEKTNKSMDFVVSRFSRLFPAYWASIIITVSFVSLFSTPFQSGIFTLKQVLVNFTMCQYWFKIKDVDGAYWTLAVELTFYILMWIVFVFNQLKKIEWICVCWIIVSIIFGSFKIPYDNYINVILILKYAPLFSGGIFFYLLKKRDDRFFIHVLIAISLFSELYLIFAERNAVNFEFQATLTPYIVIVCFYLLFYLFIYDKLSFILIKPLLFFGSISYSLYLIHETIGSIIIGWLKRILDYQLFYLPIVFGLMVCVAYLIRKFIEIPVQKVIRTYYKQNK